MSVGGSTAQAETERRLAAIVAVDIAGYSGRAETDEAAAVGEVTALADKVAGLAAAHGGRVFNVAGDGFMLEFPTCSGALAAAEQVAAEAASPVRIGVHLGEVFVAPGGDLLGHGVNVAARLCALAEPGSVVVSDDVRRAVRDPVARRLQSRGRVRLEKMKEVTQVFTLTPAAGRERRPVQSRGARLALMAALAALLLAAAAFAGWRLLAALVPPPTLKVAVKAFQAPARDAALADGLADRLNAALAQRRAPTTSRDLVERGDLGGARLVVGGTIERDGAMLRVRAHVDDARGGVELWSTTIERPGAEAAALMDAAAIEIADVIAQTREGLGPEGPRLEPEALAAYFKLVAVLRRGRGNTVESREAARRLVEAAPGFSRAHSQLAFANAAMLYYTKQPPREAARLRAEALSEAKKALAIDPHNGDAYAVSVELAASDDPATRERLLTQALAADPDHASLNVYMGDHLRAIGRQADAMAFLQHALALDPDSRPKTAANIFALAGVGRYPEARSLGQRAAATWRDNNSIRRANLLTAVIHAPPAEAKAALATFQQGEPRLDEASLRTWEHVLAARQGAYPAAKAARELMAASRAETGVDSSTAVSALVLLGAEDDAFAEIERTRQAGGELHLSNLFETPTAPLRRDRRFMPLMARLGLAQYWLASGRWPDFCAEPGLGYDCKAAAAQAAAAVGGRVRQSGSAASKAAPS